MDCDSPSGGEVTAVGSGAAEHRQHQQQHAAQLFSPEVTGFLAMARQLVTDGKPSLALQAVVMAVKAQGGDEAVLQTLQRAQMLYRRKLEAATAAEELARLFAECAIAEAHPHESIMSEASVVPPLNINADNTSILAESGRKQIVLDFCQDGSSFICLQCGGLVSNQRRDEHCAYWCSNQS